MNKANQSSHQKTDIISNAQNLSQLFYQRVQRTPHKTACQYYQSKLAMWANISWQTLADQVGQWQTMLQQLPLQAGDHVAIKLENGPDWLIFDQAAHGLGLVVVPLYVKDRADNLAYICEHAEVKLLLLSDEAAWQDLADVHDQFQNIPILLNKGKKAPKGAQLVSELLTKKEISFQVSDAKGNSLASIVYTSGTTGRPKGVMLSHQNMLANAFNGLQSVDIYPNDLFLSFLPLSHMLERSIGYYLCVMSGAEIAYNRSIALLAEDIQQLKPTVMISVPRIFERIYNKMQIKMASESFFVRKLFQLSTHVGWQRFEYQQQRTAWTPSLILWPLCDKLVASKIKNKLGGRLRVIITGGAALTQSVAHTFISLDLPIVQGYGLTESSPVISVNRLKQNQPSSIGLALPNEQVKIGVNDELLTKGDHVMLGYWKNEQATNDCIDAENWLHTGDQARIDDKGFIYITGRLKEIIVLSNGEKVPPSDMEGAITSDPLFEQVIMVGEGKSFLSALVVLNPKISAPMLQSNDIEKALLQRIAEQTRDFPGYAKIRAVAISPDAWTMDNGLLTPTLKIKRAKVLAYCQDLIDQMYQDHC
ncbi:MAG: long-chain fatty acid--CoA ligase [Mariprofundaceae bacterium]|nr:long-chain fatty acid--CoA ligase [Mariprofundaceae bacterium]